MVNGPPCPEFFKDLGTMVRKHVSNVVPALMTLGRLGFKPSLPDLDENNSKFVPWDYHYSGQYYQGQVNSLGTWHGRGVVINPGKFLQIGHFKNGQGHGAYVSISNEDMVITDGAIIHGKLEGQFVYTLTDGTK